MAVETTLTQGCGFRLFVFYGETLMKKFSLICVILFLAMLSIATVSAQDEPVRDDSLLLSLSPGTEGLVISSPTNDQDYLILVNLPLDYNPAGSYPVLYLFDAWHMFGTVTDQTKLMPFGRQLPQVIVVGIWYPGALREGFRVRNRDLSPDQQAEAFLAFLTDTLIPYIDETYPTDPEDRAIMGTSSGGDFVLYALFNAPGTFHRFVASSPGTGSDQVCINCELENGTDVSGIVFLSAGEFDGNAPRYIENAFSILQEHADENPNLTVSKHIFEDTSHMSVVPFAVSRGLQDIYCGAAYMPGTTCQVISAQQIDSVEDADFPPGLIFTTPDKGMPIRNAPSLNAIAVGGCRNTEATVLRVTEVEADERWVELVCREDTGWIQKSKLEQ
jgi:predicted alpha/beta superfamily hydrolase